MTILETTISEVTGKAFDECDTGMEFARRLCDLTGEKYMSMLTRVYQWRSGKRTPQPYFLYYVWSRAGMESPLGNWAYTCLDLLNQAGEGVPV